jgi:methylthioribose-1-phosphate isomerase
LAQARPTAVNLRWAVGQMRGVIYSGIEGDPAPRLLAEAQRIHAEDIAANPCIPAINRSELMLSDVTL